MKRQIGLIVALVLWAGNAIAATPAPVGVVAANLVSVWNQRQTAGRTLPLLRSVTTVPLPSGVKLSGNRLSLSRIADLSQWDFSGLTVAVENTVVTIRQSKFTAPGNYRLLEANSKQQTSVSVEDSEFDLSGLSNIFIAGIQASSGSNLIFRRSRFDNASVAFLMQFGNSLLIEDSFIGAMGLAAPSDAHVEAVFVNAGRATFRRTLIDLTAGSGRTTGGITGALYFESSKGPVDAELNGVIIAGTKALGMFWPVQAAARGYPVTITVRNSAIERGSSGYFGMSGVGVRIIDGGGNFDLETGHPILVTATSR